MTPLNRHNDMHRDMLAGGLHCQEKELALLVLDGLLDMDCSLEYVSHVMAESPPA